MKTEKRKYVRRNGDAANTAPAVTESPLTEVANKPPVRPLAGAVSLQDIRDKVLRERFTLSKTIAELETLSDEIEATLAFLRTQQQRRK